MYMKIINPKPLEVLMGLKTSQDVLSAAGLGAGPARQESARQDPDKVWEGSVQTWRVNDDGGFGFLRAEEL